ncbi:MAG: long-chain fatty acid--CoA ligase [Deferribacteres bacterium]|nr:long-chain fatty acid--CoA ligase [candidate division KSB1 bacterium]MCB9504229.1 long-chain fatty acid--CoA ligase [Deferribacteres bacterium]
MFETDWIARWALYTPNKLALREYQRSLEWRYGELNERLDALAHFLKDEWQLKKGDRIAVFSKNNAEYVFLFFACVKLGVILVPFNFRLMPREIDLLLGDAEPNVLLYENEFEQQMHQLQSIGKAKLFSLDLITPFLTDKLEEKPIPTTAQHAESDTVMILYTSGTTGLSKGAIITHKMLFWNSVNTALRLDINSSDHTQSYAPFFHTGGWNVLLTPFIHHGASHTLLPGFDPEVILELMQEERTTLLFGVPTMMQMLADSPLFKDADLSSVRYAIVGGSPMPIPLINIWHKKGIAIRQGYGLTEVGPNCFSLHQDDAIRKRGSIGFPNFYIQAKVMDDYGIECSDNTVGELWLKSPVVTPGYWRNDEATIASITDGWFHTGDMVTRDEDGFYFVVDRKKNMYISGGENVYPAEVEAFFYTHPAVKEVAIIGVSDDKWGEVGKAFVVLCEGMAVSSDELFEFVRGRLAKFKTPKYIEIVNEIPKNEAGKIDRKKLK